MTVKNKIAGITGAKPSNGNKIAFTAVSKSEQGMTDFVEYLKSANCMYNKSITNTGKELYYEANTKNRTKCLLCKRITAKADQHEVTLPMWIKDYANQYDINQLNWGKKKAAMKAERAAKRAAKPVYKTTKVKAKRKWSFTERIYRAYRILTGAAGK